MRRIVLCLALAAVLLPAGRSTLALDVPDDPHLVCDRAAAQAERAWNLPEGLLAAIGTVESGRVNSSGMYRRAWPWAINGEGSSYFATSKADAVSMVRTLQARGLRYIDVGCFQIDLFYHPDAFASLDDAFDPVANAQAASRILMMNRFGATDWSQAVAAYHSASVLRGGWYLQQVLAAWPGARERLGLSLTPGLPAAYAAILPPMARLVRVVTPSDSLQVELPGLPRVISPSSVPGQTRLSGGVRWLPRVLTPMGRL